jgi:hypothetical protein
MNRILCSAIKFSKVNICEGEVRFYKENESNTSLYLARCEACRERYKYEDLKEISRDEYEAVCIILQ